MRNVFRCRSRFFAAILSLVGVSCTPIGGAMYGTPHADYTVSGKVVAKERESRPIPGIKVTTSALETTMTDSQGNYSLEVSHFPGMPLDIIFTDEDGSLNFGEFKTDTVQVYTQDVELKKGHDDNNVWYSGKGSVEVNVTMERKE